jgi:hypothetical protein
VRSIDANLLKVLDGCRTKKVVTHSGDHEHFRTTETRGDTLVGTLAAESEIEFQPKDRLPRFRETIRECG